MAQKCPPTLLGSVHCNGTTHSWKIYLKANLYLFAPICSVFDHRLALIFISIRTADWIWLDSWAYSSDSWPVELYQNWPPPHGQVYEVNQLISCFNDNYFTIDHQNVCVSRARSELLILCGYIGGLLAIRRQYSSIVPALYEYTRYTNINPSFTNVSGLHR